MQKIQFEIENYDAIHEQIAADGKETRHINITDLDENGRPTNCFVIVEDIPPDETADMQAALSELGVEV